MYWWFFIVFLSITPWFQDVTQWFRTYLPFQSNCPQTRRTEAYLANGELPHAVKAAERVRGA
jgi:hypothetical protein